jgi:hypothetical protein
MLIGLESYLLLDFPGDGDRFFLFEDDFLFESSEDSSLDGEERFLLDLTGDGDTLLLLERDFLFESSEDSLLVGERLLLSLLEFSARLCLDLSSSFSFSFLLPRSSLELVL